MADKKRDLVKKEAVPPIAAPPLLEDLRRMIEDTRQGVAATVNAALTMLYWRVGKRINEEILKGERAEYGASILSTVSRELMRDYGRGFSYSALTRLLKFSDVFPDRRIVATLSQTLSWSHFCELLPLERPLQREFYAELCRIERWSIRTLRRKIDSMLYERTALSRKPEEHKGQMELYLRWLDKYERKQGEDTPIGMILCAGKKREQIELLELGRSGIHVAEYLTDPLQKEVLQEKLHKVIALARKRLEEEHEELETVNAEARGLEDRIAENVLRILEA